MDFSIEPDDDHLALKLQADEWEVNVSPSMSFCGSVTSGRPTGASVAASALVSQLRQEPSGRTSATRRALMIGHDDETWDISVTIPFGVIDQVVREIERLMTGPVL